MKFLLVIATIALIGLSITSAAVVNLGDHDDQVSMEGFKESLQKLVEDVSKQIKENAEYDDDMDLESFLRKNNLNGEEESSIVTEEEWLAGDETSPVEDDESNVNVESGIRCSWRGLSGRCCQSVRISRFRLSICLAAVIRPPTQMQVALYLNGRRIWSQSVHGRHNYNVCARKGPVKLCIQIYNIRVSSHSAQACLRLSAKVAFIRIRKSLGCFGRHFAEEKNLTAEKTPLVSTEKPQIQTTQEKFEDFFLNPKMEMKNDAFKFQQ